jgi:hypothetical protein
MAGHFERPQFGRRHIRLTAAGAAALAIALVLSACGSGTSTAKPKDTTPTTSGTTQPVVKTLGTGVTNDTIKIGVGLVDYDAIKDVPEVTEVRLHQQEIYQAFIDNINEHGGVAGRKLVPV